PRISAWRCWKSCSNAGLHIRMRWFTSRTTIASGWLEKRSLKSRCCGKESEPVTVTQFATGRDCAGRMSALASDEPSPYLGKVAALFGMFAGTERALVPEDSPTSCINCRNRRHNGTFVLSTHISYDLEVAKTSFPRCASVGLGALLDALITLQGPAAGQSWRA